MKIDKYYIAGGVAILVILIVVFTQRSDWDANKFILSADSKGNLTPVSEKYFEDQEKKIMEKVAGKVAELESLNGRAYAYHGQTDPPAWCSRGHSGHARMECNAAPSGPGCLGQIHCSTKEQVVVHDVGRKKCKCMALRM